MSDLDYNEFAPVFRFIIVIFPRLIIFELN